ncbi:MAG: thiamine phosphate synthase [Hyphomicrobiales bacterium]|nr:thiamine phosphate synthase [Hyphomicrobiales bacterium]
MPDFRPRLYLVTPPKVEPDRFVPMLDAALSGGDVAALLIDQPEAGEVALQQVAERLVPVAQARNVAAILAGDTRIAGRVQADGIHVVGTPATTRAAVEWVRPKNLMVGAGGVDTRHAAMELGELDIDYLFFGRLDQPEPAEPTERLVELAGWWAELFEIPGVVLSGAEIDSIATATESAADFVALRSAVWNYTDGPAAAVALANRIIDSIMGITG